MKTIGISPKALLAFLFPLVAAEGGAVSNWLLHGNFDQTSVKLAAAGAITSGLAWLGAYLGHPGEVVPTEVGPANDALLVEAIAQPQPGETVPQ